MSHLEKEESMSASLSLSIISQDIVMCRSSHQKLHCTACSRSCHKLHQFLGVERQSEKQVKIFRSALITAVNSISARWPSKSISSERHQSRNNCTIHACWKRKIRKKKDLPNSLQCCQSNPQGKRSAELQWRASTEIIGSRNWSEGIFVGYERDSEAYRVLTADLIQNV